MDTLTRATTLPTSAERVALLDDTAFAAFYERTERQLRGYVYRVTGRAADADDIVQEAYLRLLRVALPDEDARRKYLYRVASNLIVDRWRRGGRETTPEALDEMTAAASAADPDVARIFATLAKKDRALLWLAYVEGESHQEIAEAIGVGTRSVKVLLFRARSRLRGLLAAKGITR
jgi:RNA polymerase sigma-70 factor (ECF subfamily)